MRTPARHLGRPRRSTACAFAFAAATIAAAIPAACAASDSGLTSPMVDGSLYRDGEVKRLSGTFGRWLVVCDEITKLKQRYCSLKTPIVDGATRIVGVIDVSTGDNGQPAALVHLPLGVLVQAGLEVSVPPAAEVQQKAGLRVTAPLVRHLSIHSCDGQECFAFWNLSGAEIGSLRQDRTLAIRFQMGTMADGLLPSLAPPTTIEASVSPIGFSSAIKASLQ